ncbi:tripartite tricarboxylate transporter permease [Sulfitobacter sediminilitoris]|uniref:tripartite tricarboxylate transporter permease n=1 Tax=Sulfitobacter sediminilitoris TaxID=2698830 RepID=UPI0036DD33B9
MPAILFNTPGTPDAYMTTLDGYPLAQKGEARKALRVAHFASASGDTFSDIVLVVCAPFLAIMVESYLDLPEKTALLILSLAFIASVIGGSVGKGIISMGLGLLAAMVATGEDFYPRLTMGQPSLSEGIPIAAAILGVLILGEVFKALEDIYLDDRSAKAQTGVNVQESKVEFLELRKLFPYIGRSAVIGTCIGALPGIGSTLAATLGYTTAKRRYAIKKSASDPEFGEGAPEGIAATEAANSSVSGANLIPVLSLGIPGNAAAVFLILAMDSIGGFNPGPSVFRLDGGIGDGALNPEMVMAFGLFTTMFVANGFNWTIGGIFMRVVGVMARIPKARLLPIVLLLTLTAIYVQETSMVAVWITIFCGFLGYIMRRVGMSPLPFVIAFILGGNLEATARQAFAATGADPFFLFNSPIALVFILLAIGVVIYSLRSTAR